MSKISCVAARKHDVSCGFANVGGGVLNRYNILPLFVHTGVRICIGMLFLDYSSWNSQFAECGDDI